MTLDDLDELLGHLHRLHCFSFLLLLVEDCGPIPDGSGFDPHIAESARYYLLRVQFEELCAIQQRLLGIQPTA